MTTATRSRAWLERKIEELRDRKSEEMNPDTCNDIGDEIREPIDELTALELENPQPEIERDAEITPESLSGTQTLVTALGRKASMVIADSYEAEHSGVLDDLPTHGLVRAHRQGLQDRLAAMHRSWIELEASLTDIGTSIEILQAVIDPENN